MKCVVKHINKKNFSVVAGIFLAITILTTQSFALYHTDVSNISVEITDDEDPEDNHKQYLTQDAISAPSVQLNFDKPFHVVFEFFLSDNEDPDTEPASVPINLTFLKRISRITISPNAP